ncbi:hypothetical protein M427DRAFT_35037 [Gonapodya prolifera JEL478]|uniref:Uncharacterized protein n=1 Tax=Gonapodya prolifera (strain JEL478) TaxID=1344416 RepID=A0A139A5Q1_GONPJ|nr:hypothetical protein M427DRAFT_35037 [Gonapodya prolifera JEL478]|eukprot:KXS12152.1 hypothetical protein M427DRAFT_35037 [Gonapodya prolifera JEL478]
MNLGTPKSFYVNVADVLAEFSPELIPSFLTTLHVLFPNLHTLELVLVSGRREAVRTSHIFTPATASIWERAVFEAGLRGVTLVRWFDANSGLFSGGGAVGDDHGVEEKALREVMAFPAALKRECNRFGVKVNVIEGQCGADGWFSAL